MPRRGNPPAQCLILLCKSVNGTRRFPRSLLLPRNDRKNRPCTTTVSLRGPQGPWQSPGSRLEDRCVNYYVYILTNKNKTVLYTGVTKDLVRRVYEHKTHADPNSFTAKYKIDRLVYFEETSDVKAAIEREKQIKSWSRDRKTDLIFKKNPHWADLYTQILG